MNRGMLLPREMHTGAGAAGGIQGEGQQREAGAHGPPKPASPITMGD